MPLDYPTAKTIKNPSLSKESYTRSSLVHSATIPANSSRFISMYGDRFYLLQCTAPIEIKTEATGFKPYRKGTGEQFPEDLRFERLEVKNDNSYAVEIKIWVGFGEYIDQRFEIVDAYSEIRSDNVTTIAAGATLTYDGEPASGEIQRKAFVLTNLDPNSRLDVLDKNDNLAVACFAEQSITLPVCGEIKVKNPSGADITFYVGEIYYKENGV